MFKHLFNYNLRILLRNRIYVFWTLIFPMILVSLLLVLQVNMEQTEKMRQIPVAIVEKSENAYFLHAIEQVSDPDEGLFNVSYTTEEEAKKLLYGQDIRGYFIIDKEPQLMVLTSNEEQQVLRAFLNICRQKEGTGEVINVDFMKQEMIEEVSGFSKPMNSSLSYFYTILAMASMYSFLPGIASVYRMRTSFTPIALRSSLAVGSRLVTFLAASLSSILLHMGNIFIITAYLKLILKVELTDNLPALFGVCLMGNICGYLLGLIIGNVRKGEERHKIVVGIGIMGGLCFLAGLFHPAIKYRLEQKLPLISRMNPVNSLMDSFYSLYYYDSMTRFWENLLTVFVWCLVLGVAAIWIIGRAQDDSI